MSEPWRILVVDDEPAMRVGLEELLTDEGYDVTATDGGEAARRALEKNPFDLVMTDLVMPGMDGMALLEWVQEHVRETPVIMITGHSTVPSAVEAMQKGAFHYLAKPFQLDEVRALVKRALEKRKLETENLALREELKTYQGRHEIIGISRGIHDVLDMVDRLGPTNSPVLIYGETGTGKELIARRIHQVSGRRNRAFLTVNSASLPETLLESELFGHAKGSFTGAHSSREGLFQAAEGGTLFLDEIGDVGLAAQARLLRVLESGEVRRVGENTTQHVDVRVIAATNRDLQQAVQEKDFREDLYYRLNVVTLTLPPLRDRREDIALLAEHYAKRTAVADDSPFGGFSTEFMAFLNRYAWPGNVRELVNVVRRAVILSGGRAVTLQDLPPNLLQAAESGTGPAMRGGDDSLDAVERQHIIEVLRTTRGNKSRAADILGISRPTLRSKLVKYAIDAKELK